MKKTTTFFIALLAFVCTPIVAKEVGSKRVELGFLQSSGNTDSEKLNLGVHLNHQFSKWNHDFVLQYFQGESNGETDVDSLLAEYKISRSLSERLRLFAEVSYLDDDFDGFAAQRAAGFGVDYSLFDEDNFKWDIGTGVGYRDTQELITQSNGSKVRGEDINGVTYLVRSNLVYDFSDTAKLSNETKADIASDNSFLTNTISLSVSMSSRLALKASYLVRHNSNPPSSSEKTDKITSINLVYSLSAKK